VMGLEARREDIFVRNNTDVNELAEARSQA
jgi:hypothetical protein